MHAFCKTCMFLSFSHDGDHFGIHKSDGRAFKCFKSQHSYVSEEVDFTFKVSLEVYRVFSVRKQFLRQFLRNTVFSNFLLEGFFFVDFLRAFWFCWFSLFRFCPSLASCCISLSFLRIYLHLSCL